MQYCTVQSSKSTPPRWGCSPVWEVCPLGGCRTPYRRSENQSRTKSIDWNILYLFTALFWFTQNSCHNFFPGEIPQGPLNTLSMWVLELLYIDVRKANRTKLTLPLNCSSFIPIQPWNAFIQQYNWINFSTFHSRDAPIPLFFRPSTGTYIWVLANIEYWYEHLIISLLF